ncbi:probable inorganic phosphate transporter 1-8 [Quercus suber]|uniref:Inorganic phosphate transporter 1-8 n=1 Tax=Quercus suber TaxID=58331 RepID=A0AAW0LRU5_QUESU|nr:probable inorganic phosphate transporter 1-8 [Quercus suber]POE52807.1 putative inorganic phosphate transporter 1-8 [Quercus suber]
MASKVLSALDSARTQLYHFRAIIIVGMGLFYDAYSYGVLFPDAYHLFCIPLILILNGRVYYEKEAELNKYVIPPVVVFTMVVIAFVGTAIGQRVLGWLGDLIGRRRVYRFRLIIVVLSSIACGLSKCSSRNSVLVSLGLYRFVLGVGIGVDYPFSANESGTFIAALFSKQFLEILGLLAVTMEVCAIFDRAFHRVDPTPKETDIAWIDVDSDAYCNSGCASILHDSESCKVYK